MYFFLIQAEYREYSACRIHKDKRREDDILDLNRASKLPMLAEKCAVYSLMKAPDNGYSNEHIGELRSLFLDGHTHLFLSVPVRNGPNGGSTDGRSSLVTESVIHHRLICQAGTSLHWDNAMMKMVVRSCISLSIMHLRHRWYKQRLASFFFPQSFPCLKNSTINNYQTCDRNRKCQTTSTIIT